MIQNFLSKFISCFFLISVGELKYKIFLLRAFSIKKTPITDVNRIIAKREALFFTFFGSIKCFKSFYCMMLIFSKRF